MSFPLVIPKVRLYWTSCNAVQDYKQKYLLLQCKVYQNIQKYFYCFLFLLLIHFSLFSPHHLQQSLINNTKYSFSFLQSSSWQQMTRSIWKIHLLSLHFAAVPFELSVPRTVYRMDCWQSSGTKPSSLAK